MKKKWLILLCSIVVAFGLMTGGLGAWQRELTIRGQISVEPEIPANEFNFESIFQDGGGGSSTGDSMVKEDGTGSEKESGEKSGSQVGEESREINDGISDNGQGGTSENSGANGSGDSNDSKGSANSGSESSGKDSGSESGGSNERNSGNTDAGGSGDNDGGSRSGGNENTGGSDSSDD